MKWTTNNLTITFQEGPEDAPLVLLHGNPEEEGSLLEEIQQQSLFCSIAMIEGMDWNRDLPPWDAPAAFKKAEPFVGGADAHLGVIVDTVLPEIAEHAGHAFPKIYLAGYSLAGLFAVYSAYQTEVFDGFVSASGSLWYPGFMEFAETHSVSSKVKKAYFSVGDKEKKTRNAMMQPVEENTMAMEEHLEKTGITTIFELNEGGHFNDPAGRLLKGIRWILDGEEINVE